MFTKTKGLTLLAAVLIAGSLAGCEASVGTNDMGKELEKIIKVQLADKVKEQVPNPKVEQVDCVEASENNFDCLAKLSYDAEGGRKTDDVSISGVCKDGTCKWETKD